MACENTRYARGGQLSEWLAAARHIHFIGICGAGMRSLARMCHEGGYLVTGSDDDPVGEGGLALSLSGKANSEYPTTYSYSLLIACLLRQRKWKVPLP